MNAIRPIISQESYGFILRQGSGGAACAHYPIKIYGKNFIVSDTHYVKITTPERTIYLGTDHNGATFFAKQEELAGRLSGKEEWLHIDKNEHPDNHRLDEDFVFSPDSTLTEIAEKLDRDNLNIVTGVSVANFMSVVALLYPQMTFRFLHNNLAPGGVATDWYGMEYDQVMPVLEWQTAGVARYGRVVSMDLDVLGYYYDLANEETKLLVGEEVDVFAKSLALAQPSKLAMFFVSPSYLGFESGRQWLQQVIDNIVV